MRVWGKIGCPAMPPLLLLLRPAFRLDLSDPLPPDRTLLAESNNLPSKFLRAAVRAGIALVWRLSPPTSCFPPVLGPGPEDSVGAELDDTINDADAVADSEAVGVAIVLVSAQ